MHRPVEQESRRGARNRQATITQALKVLLFKRLQRRDNQRKAAVHILLRRSRAEHVTVVTVLNSHAKAGDFDAQERR